MSRVPPVPLFQEDDFHQIQCVMEELGLNCQEGRDPFVNVGHDEFRFHFMPFGDSSTEYKVQYAQQDIHAIKDFLGKCVPYLAQQKCEHRACVVCLSKNHKTDVWTWLLLVRKMEPWDPEIHVILDKEPGTYEEEYEPDVVVAINALHIRESVDGLAQHRFYGQDTWMSQFVFPSLGELDFVSEPIHPDALANLMTFGALRCLRPA